MSEFTDEELMAYADGELAEDRASELDLALVEDTDLSDRLAMFVETRSLSKAALDEALNAPVPEHLVQFVRDQAEADRQKTAETVIPFPTTQRSRGPAWALPLAASLALAIGLGAGLSLSPGGNSDLGSIEIATVQNPQITAALNTLPSGADNTLDNGARIALIATFYDGADTLCREFEYDRTDNMTIVSVACQADGQWDVQMAVAAAAATDTGYAPASSLDTLDAYLAATQAGPPLEPDAEAAALATLR
ncbi:anti-sigma factor family protein [Tateyamaria sp. SN3-11]|uniref:anti-sigma factor family protein n=1 Tax=Tateyamaria sp. SN3-11 TaxID=3092147 RepID=UPI0039E78A57